MRPTKVFDVFKACTEAILRGVLIRQVSITDKEFHFQNWFEARLTETGVSFDRSGRNSYPDLDKDSDKPVTLSQNDRDAATGDAEC